MAEGALLVVDGRRNELTVECPGMRRSSPTSVDQVRVKSGSGTCQSTFTLLEFLLTSNVNPPNGECARYPLQNWPLWSSVILDPLFRKWGRPIKESPDGDTGGALVEEGLTM